MIGPAGSAADRSALRVILTEFQESMAPYAGAGHDAELAEDSRSITRVAGGWAWVARVVGESAGWLLLYSASSDLAEFKRLRVLPPDRGQDTGRSIVRTVIDTARVRGTGRATCPTPPWADAAQLLYASLWSERTPQRFETRLISDHHDDAIFTQLALGEPPDGPARGRPARDHEPQRWGARTSDR